MHVHWAVSVACTTDVVIGTHAGVAYIVIVSHMDGLGQHAVEPLGKGDVADAGQAESVQFVHVDALLGLHVRSAVAAMAG